MTPVGYERALCGAQGPHTTRSEVRVAEIEPLLNAEVPVSRPIIVSLPLLGSHDIPLYPLHALSSSRLPGRQ